MKTVRFSDPAGYARVGKWTSDGIVEHGRTYDPADVDVLPPVAPTKIICLAGNYLEHLRESPGRDLPEDIPDRPELFMKGPNAVAGHRDTVTLPTPGTDPAEPRVDFEAELGVVIDEQCRDIDAAEADEVVRGYTCMNDVSNRNDQAVEQNWIRGKAFDNSAPLGPVVASPDEVDDDPRIQLRVNGETKQDSSDDEMVFSVPETIEEITKFVTLEPDDVVAMGTTYGVGPLEDGDRVEIEIEGIGTLEHDVAVE